MDILDNAQKIKQLDRSNMLSSIEALGDQCRHAWNETKKIAFPAHFRTADKIVVFGMGGSALGAHVIKSLFSDRLRVPLEIVNHYSIPAWVDEKTLVILSSYSGSTEETVAAAREIHKRTKKIAVIATGSDLEKLATKNHWPIYTIDPAYNPCGQPRMAVGYSVVGQLGILAGSGLIKISEAEIKSIVNAIAQTHKKCGVAIKQKNPAKEAARKIQGHIPLIFASEFLEGNAHAFANQTNENAKNLAAYFVIPELNHHLLEGLRFPKNAPKDFIAVCIESGLYHPRVQARYSITQRILKKHGIASFSHRLQGKERVTQSFELLTFGGYVAFYLSMLNGIDPSPIPMVDFFKEELQKV